jgi:glycosyltransferase involved in cell wall biosynthesis
MTTMERKQVLFLTTSYPLRPDAVSGIFIKRLVDALREQVDILVVTPDDNITTTYPAAVKAFRYAPKRKQLLAHVHGGIPNALGKNRMNYVYALALATSFCLTTAKLAINAHLLHANWSVPGVIAGIIGRILSKPTLTTLRGEDVTRAKTSRLFKLLLSSCLTLNRSVVCVSSDMQLELQTLFPRHKDKIRHIANGVGAAFVEQRTISLEGDTLQLLCVGSLIPRKNFSSVISAINQCGARERIQLTIAGDGPEQKALEVQATTLGLGPQVRFLGSVPPEQVAGLYHNAHLFIIPSLSEGRPNVLLEAMAAGLPILAADIAGIVELISDGISGHLFKPNDTSRLAQLIDTLIDNAEGRHRLGSNAQMRIQQENVTWQRTAEQYHQLYQSLTE